MIKSLLPHFVEHIPEELESGILYISLKCHVASHLCACGCGTEVVTPLEYEGMPAGAKVWKLTGVLNSVTLRPSIGNWQFLCRSHYWITDNMIVSA